MKWEERESIGWWRVNPERVSSLFRFGMSRFSSLFLRSPFCTCSLVSEGSQTLFRPLWTKYIHRFIGLTFQFFSTKQCLVCVWCSLRFSFLSLSHSLSRTLALSLSLVICSWRRKSQWLSVWRSHWSTWDVFSQMGFCEWEISWERSASSLDSRYGMFWAPLCWFVSHFVLKGFPLSSTDWEGDSEASGPWHLWLYRVSDMWLDECDEAKGDGLRLWLSLSL